jgi:hypothetical protein
MLPILNLPTLEEDSNNTLDPFSSPKPPLITKPLEEEDEEDKENTTVFDYLGECGTLGAAPINVMTMKMRSSIAPSTTAFTPKQRRLSSMARESLDPNRIVNMSQSPLLKLALISSQSKRLSMSRPLEFSNL